jgi:hypothetical protein
MNQSGGISPVYVRARRALLDALQALGPHRKAVILVEAQAVYLHVGEAREPLSSFTIDADLALNPAELLDEPSLHAALSNAGFRRKEQPGLWFTPDNVEVDLLVPASLAGSGRRGVDLGPHHERTGAMRAAGLEAALVDNAPHRIAALDPDDQRSFDIAIAGPAALLIAKLHKIGERIDGPRDRLKNKDASDLFLLLRATETATLAATLRRLRELPETAGTTQAALRYLRDLFTSDADTGIGLLRAAVAGIEDEEIVAQSCVVLATDLLDALN